MYKTRQVSLQLFVRQSIPHHLNNLLDQKFLWQRPDYVARYLSSPLLSYLKYFVQVTC